jgi:hypothetical protein
MPDRVYIETTIVSYSTARPNRDVVIAGHQQTTHEWWDTRRHLYELCASRIVLDESAAGDPAAAQERLAVLSSMTLLQTTPEALSLAKAPRATFGSKTMNDPIVEEIRNYRAAYAARFNYDLDAIFHDIKQGEKEWEERTGLKFVSYPPRRVEPPPAPKPATPAVLASADAALPQATRPNER